MPSKNKIIFDIAVGGFCLGCCVYRPIDGVSAIFLATAAIWMWDGIRDFNKYY